ncbi:MAG TPA: class I SAM-dependent methyltransferase [Burkholderiales bacterium]|nr:class I SAM-dependent methyltransferase [Burkholderiales bacterium]
MLAALRPPIRLETHRGLSRADFSFLRKRFTPRTVFMEIGAADCTLALRAAGYVERVYAIDVSGRFLQSVLVPVNLRLVLCSGVRIPVPEAAVDLAWGGDFMDHLHPEDAATHLENVRRALVAGGEYLCETASPRETRRRMLAAGFSAVRIPLFSRLLKSVRITAVK